LKHLLRALAFLFIIFACEIAYSAESGYIVYAVPSSFTGGVSTQVTVQVRNTGDSDDMIIECDSKPIGWSITPSYHNPYIASGSYYNAYFTVIPPTSGGSGTIVWKFYDDDLFSHELLDTEYQSVSAIAAMPDLIVLDIWTEPSSIIEGQAFKIKATIKNQGDATADAGLFANQEALFYVDGVKSGEGDDYDNLAPGSTITVESINITGPSAGNHTIKVKADGNNEVPESNEGNNERTESVTVLPPTGTIHATLTNQRGELAPANGTTTPRFQIYPAAGDSAGTLSGNNPVDFTGVPVGGYWVEGYSTGTFLGEEFWTSEYVEITEDDQTEPVSVELIRNYPYANEVHFWDAGSSFTPPKAVPIGADIQAYVIVKNDRGTVYPCRVWVGTSETQGGTIDWNYATYNTINGWQTVEVHSQEGFPVKCDTSSTGKRFYVLKVETRLENGNEVLTDTWDWSAEEAYQVVDDPETTINSSPSGAKIYLNDSNIGTTPYSSDEFYAGANLKVYLPGYDIFETTIESEDIGSMLNCSLIAVGPEWTTYSADVSNTSFLNTGPFDSVSEKWTYTTPTVAWSLDEEIAPTVADNQVFMVSSYDGGLYCIDLLTGNLNWSRTDCISETSRISNQPSISDGLVVCGVSSGYLMAFDAVTGETIWQYDIEKTILSNITIHNGVIYVNVDWRQGISGHHQIHICQYRDSHHNWLQLQFYFEKLLVLTSYIQGLAKRMLNQFYFPSIDLSFHFHFRADPSNVIHHPHLHR